MYMYIMLHKNKHVFNVTVPWIFSSSGVSFPPSASTKVYQVILHVLYTHPCKNGIKVNGFYRK